MSDKEQSDSSTSPNKGPIRPKLVRFAEAAFIVAFCRFVLHSDKPMTR